MDIFALGLDFKGEPIFPGLAETDFARSLVNTLDGNISDLRNIAGATMEGVSYRGEVTRETEDPADPTTAGWTYLVNGGDARRDDIAAIMAPLARHRNMVNDQVPLLYNGEPPDEWFNWMTDNYFGLYLDNREIPAYILIVGGPEQIPFRFQSLLDVSANVGRIDFDTLEELEQYVAKLIRIETADDPLVTRDAVLFGPDGGITDPTFFSCKYMVEPIARYMEDDLGFTPHTLLRDDATKAKLLDTLGSLTPAIVYTASHGLGATSEPHDVQRRYNGAICCQHSGPLDLNALFCADDIPVDRPFLEGSVFFQFACFGYGTPAKSDYAHWLDGVPETYTGTDFVAALPKKLLAHPRGPVAYIGHMDTAFLHAFADPNAPHALDRWHTRIAPFVTAVEDLLGVRPSGLAMKDLNERFNIANMIITNTYDRIRRGNFQWTEERETRFVDTWITRGDAQNYMVLGDPAAHLRIPAP